MQRRILVPTILALVLMLGVGSLGHVWLERRDVADGMHVSVDWRGVTVERN